MPWVKKEPPQVPSLEDYGSASAKRFTSICMTHLLMHRKPWLEKKMKEFGITDMRSAIEFVIRYVDYPLTWGRPDDRHIWNAFSGKACYKVFMDYWQTAAETMMTVVLNKKNGKNGYGDCEDSSILITAMLRILDVPAYEVFGLVYRGSTLLGGHGWSIAQFPDRSWRIIESTLDEPPRWYDGYPVIIPNLNEWSVGDLRYVGWIKFNEKDYFEWMPPAGPHLYLSMLASYMKLGRREKESFKKYKTIAEAYGIKTKAHRKYGLLARLRWRW